MKVQELETYLTQFLSIARQAEADFITATADEQYFEDAAQDLLHVAELAPSVLSETELVITLHRIRTERRDAKKELEGARIWKEWAIENKKSLDKLEQILGALRKVVRRQATSTYRFKTDVIGVKNEYLKTDDERDSEYEQLTIDMFIKEN